MFGKTALLAVGMIVISSASLAAQQKTPPTNKPTAAAPAPAQHSPINMWSADQIKEAQIALADLKLYDGKPTGEMNTDTEEALKKFQRTRNMAPTGQLSDSVLVLLRKAEPARR
jgi:peptidoglycan hydrolase-like protein with peptidoglycan-binding domain